MSSASWVAGGPVKESAWVKNFFEKAFEEIVSFREPPDVISYLS